VFRISQNIKVFFLVTRILYTSPSFQILNKKKAPTRKTDTSPCHMAARLFFSFALLRFFLFQYRNHFSRGFDEIPHRIVLPIPPEYFHGTAE
jgi:hypothetical protein